MRLTLISEEKNSGFCGIFFSHRGHRAEKNHRGHRVFKIILCDLCAFSVNSVGKKRCGIFFSHRGHRAEKNHRGHRHGNTYEDALRNALEVLQLLKEETSVEKSEVTQQLIQTA